MTLALVTMTKTFLTGLWAGFKWPLLMLGGFTLCRIFFKSIIGVIIKVLRR
ncbi:MAG TPA: hypothetical protein VG710_17925 [Opitutus sp.]|nr:hypothetical protein [Opitutus sp.]